MQNRTKRRISISDATDKEGEKKRWVKETLAITTRCFSSFSFFWNATTLCRSYQSNEAHLTSTSLRGPIHSQPFSKFEQSTCKFKICLWQPLSEKTWKMSQSIKHPTDHSTLSSINHVFISCFYLRFTKCHPKRANQSKYKWIQLPCHDQNSGYQVDSGAVYSFRRKFKKGNKDSDT